MLCHLCGTRFLPDLRGAILLIEEIAEPPYRIDRMLTHLRLTGVLDQVAGVVVGRLLRCDAPQGRPPLPIEATAVVAERLADLDVPVAAGAPVGHGDRNVALPLGLEAVLDAAAGTLTFSAATPD
jgi:muramoyltetrapeptide carboxypeptidase